MGFGNTSSKSYALDSRVALDGGGWVLQGGSAVFNSGKGKTNWTSIALIAGAVLLLAVWLWKGKNG